MALKKLGKFFLRPDLVKKACQEKAMLSLEDLADEDVQETKRLLSVGGGGGRSIGKGTPSAPGDPPHVQSGVLRTSIKKGKFGTTFRIGPTVLAHYGGFLEGGTRHIEERPYLRPALLNMFSKWKKSFKKYKLSATTTGIKMRLKS